ncbi:MAG: hypothetical protein K2F81_07645 [Ruminococcus sp.]|nr:hypothetical protein [Ruminococcus sp.]
MSVKLYSNEPVKRLIKSMISKEREPHSIVITGERGQGKKALAKYIAASLLCEAGQGEPCGECKSCRMLERGGHPDFITANANENGNYQVDIIRELVSDAVVKPNEGKFKVYLIPDLDRSLNTSVQVQNILLKLIEEPPEHCIIILTAATKEIFLETVISRVLCLNVLPCNDEECRNYLENRYGQYGDYTSKDFECAAAFGGGTIGRCIEYLEDKSVALAMDIAKLGAEAICKGSEYELLKAFFAADGKKAIFRRVIELLQEAFRDALILRLGFDKTVGCMPEMSAKLAGRFNIDGCRGICELLGDYINRIDANANLTLAMNSLAARFFR